MVKKKILFVLYKMSSGGPQRSLLNLLEFINPEEFEVELLLFQNGGILFKEIPEYVSVRFIKPKGLYGNFQRSPISYLCFVGLRSFVKLIILFFVRGRQKQEHIDWLSRSLFIKSDKIKYDLAVAYAEGMNIKYLASKVKAKIKVGRIPTDYKSANLCRDIDFTYYKEMDYLFVVSGENENILKDVFPEFKDKISIFSSIISPARIKAKVKKGSGFNDDYNGLRILTIARFDDAKGIDLAMQTCVLLKAQGLSARWYFLGNGPRDKYLKQISLLGIDDNFKLLRETSNPYTYLFESDIYVQPSRYEGKSNSVNEAKALRKSIIITNFSTAKDHIINMKEGIIADMTPESIFNAIMKLNSTPELGDQFRRNLEMVSIGNEKEVEKLLDLVKV